MSPDPDKQAKTHTHTHMRRESRNTIRFLRSLFEFPVSVERVFVRKKKKERKKGEKTKREREKKRDEERPGQATTRRRDICISAVNSRHAGEQ